MVEWVWELYGEGKVLEAADPKLCRGFDAKQMECLMIVGLCSIAHSPTDNANANGTIFCALVECLSCCPVIVLLVWFIYFAPQFKVSQYCKNSSSGP
ncbi:hypothetical protein ACFX2I_030813 [Malus domestica]